MPIPGPFDRKLGEIADLHAHVMLKLGLIHRGQFRHTPDGYVLDGAASEQMIRVLREALQSYANAVMQLAHEGADA